jgi:hypothetical protein
VFFYKNGAGVYVSVPSSASPNTAGVTRLSVTVTIPTNATEAFVRLYHGGYQGSGSVWWDTVIVEEGEMLGEYFDGSFESTVKTTYEWTGIQNLSSSIKKPTQTGPRFPTPEEVNTLLGG